MADTVIHWFRRDLRLDDNTGFLAACKSADYLIPLFILDEALIHTERGGGGPRVGFMVDTLHALNDKLVSHGSRLVIRQGDPLAVLRDLIEETGASHLTYNRDYSPYARQRDKRVVDALRADGITVDTYQDLVLHEFNEIKTKNDAPYQVYTPYRKQWEMLPKPQPEAIPDRIPPLPQKGETGELPTVEQLGGCYAEAPITQVGEDIALEMLADFVEHGLADYDHKRDMLAEDGTSRLSSHLRWGSISIRRCYAAAAEKTSDGAAVWISELAWRDFYQQVLAYNKTLIQKSYREKYDRIQWENDANLFEAWCAGKTGYPVVDAAMRQLRQTGWMHNRARMIVASFLCKDLLIDWRWGEKYFMQRLLDGDTAANNGGWQWAAGTGTDAAPYFRIFNPITQGEKYDPNGIYIRRWLPELASIADKHIHMPWEASNFAEVSYPAPIVDHKTQRERALEMYSVVKED